MRISHIHFFKRESSLYWGRGRGELGLAQWYGADQYGKTQTLAVLFTSTLSLEQKKKKVYDKERKYWTRLPLLSGKETKEHFLLADRDEIKSGTNKQNQDIQLK